MERLYTEYEKRYDVFPVLHWMEKHWEVPLLAVLLYLAAIALGRRYKAAIKQMNLPLRKPMAAWNFTLAAFSAIGLLRTAPHLLHMLASTPFEATVCENPVDRWGVGATGLWVQLFILSKLPELGDTLFLILKGSDVIFLHWYHHVTVLLYCWLAYATRAAAGLYFVVMNYGVHAVMYTYYGLQIVYGTPVANRVIPAKLVTSLQIAQMFVGVIICAATWHYSAPGKTAEGGECCNGSASRYAGAFMYLSYLILFVQFAVDKYLKRGTRRRAQLDEKRALQKAQ
jgi:hypothetical protein